MAGGGGGIGGAVGRGRDARRVGEAVRGGEGAARVARVDGGLALLPRAHLARVEDAGRVGAPLEAELRPVGHLHAAVLEDVRVRVEDGHAARLVPREDLAQPVVGRVGRVALRPEERERREARAAVEVDDLEVLHQLVDAKVVLDLLRELERAARLEHRLEVGHALVVLERVERRVVPTELVKRPRRVRRADDAAHLAAALGDEPLDRPDRRRRDLRDGDVARLAVGEALPPVDAARRVEELVAVEVTVGDRRLEGGHAAREDGGRVRDVEGEGGRLLQRRERRRRVGPRLRLREGHLDRGDDAVGAVRVDDREDVAAQLEHARLRLLRRHHAQREHRAVLREAAVQHRAPARRAARDEAAEGRRAARRRVLAQLPPVLARRVLEIAQLDAGARAHRACSASMCSISSRPDMSSTAPPRSGTACRSAAPAPRVVTWTPRRTPAARAAMTSASLVAITSASAHAPVELRLQDGRVPVEVLGAARNLLLDVGAVGGREHADAGGPHVGDKVVDAAAATRSPWSPRRCVRTAAAAAAARECIPRRPPGASDARTARWRGGGANAAIGGGGERGDGLDLDDKLGARKARYDHQRRCRRGQLAEHFIPRRHVPGQMFAPRHEGIQPHNVLNACAGGLEDLLDVLQRDPRLLLGTLGRDSVGLDPELARGEHHL